MKRSRPRLDPAHVHTEIDNYKFVCYTLVILEKVFAEAIAAKSNQGRTLRTSEENQISRNETVTPDMVIETSGKGSYRAINEIKAWLPKDRKHWHDIAEQLKKYDDRLTGWEFSGNLTHDIMLTTDPVFTAEFKKYLEQLGVEKKLDIERNFSILESMIKERAVQSFFVRKFSGSISNPKLDEALTSGSSYMMYNVVEDIEKLKFYDSKPPDIYMMMIMWDMVFPRFLSREDNRKLAKNRTVELDLRVDKIHKILSKFTPESNPHCIKRRWIRSALDLFKDMGIAKRVKADEDQYAIKYRKHKEKTQDWILKKAIERSAAGGSSTDGRLAS